MILQMNLKKNLHTLTVSPNVNPNLENFIKKYNDSMGKGCDSFL